MDINPLPIPLSKLAVGAACKVASIEVNGLLRRRVLDLGIVPGTAITCVRTSPAGNPTAYRVRETLIALRNEDAAQILVYPA